jgi:pimeloyl-ACP methyl ester carboxylesterase
MPRNPLYRRKATPERGRRPSLTSSSLSYGVPWARRRSTVVARDEILGSVMMPYYDNGPVRIRYEEGGSGFPVLVMPGGGLNSRVTNWTTAVYNFFDAFKNEYRVITMDQRNANQGESTGSLDTTDPWGTFTADQLGLMDHLGIGEFMALGCCIGGPFVLKLMERAPDRVLAGVLCQPVGHRPEDPDVMYRSGREYGGPSCCPIGRTLPPHRCRRTSTPCTARTRTLFTACRGTS